MQDVIKKFTIFKINKNENIQMCREIPVARNLHILPPISHQAKTGISSKKIRFLSLKPIFLILLMIRNRPFEAQILSFNAMATEGRGVTQQTFIQGGSARTSNPLPFYIPFFTKKVPLFHIPSVDKWYPF